MAETGSVVASLAGALNRNSRHGLLGYDTVK